MEQFTENIFAQEAMSQQNGTAPVWWDMLVEGGYGKSGVTRGDVFESTILAFGDRSISVDVDGKRDGIVQARDLERVPEPYLEKLKVGDTIPVRVIKAPLKDDAIIVSLRQGLEQEDWIRAEKLVEERELVEVVVTGTNRGGILVSFGRLQGFVPNSHLVRIPRGTNGTRRDQLKREMIGTTMTVVPIEVEIRRRRLVVSERAAMSRNRQEILQELHEGAIRTGVVSNLVNFGAFIDLGGIDGLLHISEIAWEHVEKPSDIMSIGEEVEVYVLAVDRERERISLSRKRLLPDPWDEVTKTLFAGDSIEGALTHLAEFGAFVDIGHGIEGLVHNSEIPDIEQTRSNLLPGTKVQVKVLHIDAMRHRISLHLEAVLPVENEPASTPDPEGRKAPEELTLSSSPALESVS